MNWFIFITIPLLRGKGGGRSLRFSEAKGFEPLNGGIKTRCLTTWRRLMLFKKENHKSWFLVKYLVYFFLVHGSPLPDLNRRLFAYHANTLPAELRGQKGGKCFLEPCFLFLEAFFKLPLLFPFDTRSKKTVCQEPGLNW